MKKQLAVWLLALWLVIGIFFTLTAFFGWFGSWTGIVMAGLVVLTCLSVGYGWLNFWRVAKHNLRIKLGLLFVVWFCHSLQVFVPETGFDALWYHLPVAKKIVSSQSLVFDPEIYQTVNPLFSDLYFAGGFGLAGEMGSKMVAFSFGLVFLISVWLVARKFLNRDWALSTILIVSVFQPVAWQSASFYVDVAKALWEISALFCILELWQSRKHQTMWLIISSLFIGASLGTKAFSWLLLPVFLVIIYLVLINRQMNSRQAVVSKPNVALLINLWLILFFVCLIPLPYILHAWVQTGDAFFPITQHLLKIQEISGVAVSSAGEVKNLLAYFFNRLLSLPLAPFYFETARDYIFPLGLLLLPFSISGWRQKKLQTSNLVLIIYALYSWLIWWFVPPLSTRYAISGFVILILIWLIGLNSYTRNIVAKRSKNFNWRLSKKMLEKIILLMVLVNFLPRLIVGVRSSRYLLGFETSDQYLEQFYDGNIDTKLRQWRGK